MRRIQMLSSYIFTDKIENKINERRMKMKNVRHNDHRNYYEVIITLVALMTFLGICLIKIAQMNNNCVGGIF